MNKIIHICECKCCPYIGYIEFADKDTISGKPYCSKMGTKRIEYTTVHIAGVVNVVVTSVIPKWCPLETE